MFTFKWRCVPLKLSAT